MSGFTKEQIEDLLVNVLDTPVMKDWKGSKIQFCCTIHGEKIHLAVLTLITVLMVNLTYTDKYLTVFLW